MPEFQWDPVEFLNVLNVVPTESEHGLSYHYRVERPDVRLEVAVWPLNPDVSIKLYCSSQQEPLVNLQLLDCPAARVVQDKRGRYIEFAAANAFAGRYDATDAAPYGFRLWLEPILQVEPYAYPV
jgi:hypothetical protein